MALPVDVRSIDALREFRGHLAAFGEELMQALCAADMEARRALDWLANDQKLHWQAEIRRRHQLMERARTELHRKRTSQMFGHVSQDGEAAELLRQAKARLEESEAMLQKVRRWLPLAQQAVADYRGGVRPLADLADGGLERSLAVMDRLVASLEAYIGLAPPSSREERPIPAPVAVVGTVEVGPEDDAPEPES